MLLCVNRIAIITYDDARNAENFKQLEIAYNYKELSCLQRGRASLDMFQNKRTSAINMT